LIGFIGFNLILGGALYLVFKKAGIIGGPDEDAVEAELV
jgi:hypothetical protein